MTFAQSSEGLSRTSGANLSKPVKGLIKFYCGGKVYVAPGINERTRF